MSTPMNDNTLVTLKLDTSTGDATLAELEAFIARARALGIEDATLVQTRRNSLWVTEGEIE